MPKKDDKGNKNLYLWTWVARLLDAEGEDYDGPGVVAGAAIYHFSQQTIGRKKKILQQYRNEEVKRAYDDKDTKSLAEQDHSAALRAVAKSECKRGESAQTSKSG